MKLYAITAAALLGLASGAGAADLGSPRSPVAMAATAPAFNWTGFYLGGYLGGAWSTSRHDFSPFGTHGSVNQSGIIGGLTAGYNWQMNSLVLGLEADLGLSGLRNATTAFCCFTNQKWDSSLRGRAGFAVDRALFFVTGGLAVSGIQAGEPGFSVGNTVTRAGWTVGAGVEGALTPNWTVKAEYRYADYGRWVGYGGGLPHQVTLRSHSLRLGVNYLFSSGPSAVVARY
ncbi:outer membrane protein [Phreatobacter oligotrophus]|uniref:outer membrane protein n=1 Tax=Phreatobacter oligotrophus TaxID=1122261 RepID=UPI0023521D82|nr:outer membrane protein [Phreatobacter oligotrophus]MBX9989720.1 porin family protein [Phreatobacter oligotrophus]